MINNLKKKYKKYIILFLIFCILLIPNLSFAVGQCSKDGYTIATINGINTIEKEARENKDNLKNKLSPMYNSQPLIVDFLYNPTHGKIFDALDTANQIYFEKKSLNIQDSDFAQMLTYASTKLTTQKVLLVGHSQGNFYANTFYDAVVDEPGGVPNMSIGVYSVGTPASKVAGGGLYLTSKTDQMISGTVAKFPLINILKWNTDIKFNKNDGDSLGHSFSKIYLEYEDERIVSDIKHSLNKLKSNNIQKENAPCFDPPKLTWTQKVQGKVLAFVDPVSIPTQEVIYVTVSGSIKVARAVGNSVLNGASSLASNVSSFTQSLFKNNKKIGKNSGGVVIQAFDEQENTPTESASASAPTSIPVSIKQKQKENPKQTVEETPRLKILPEENIKENIKENTKENIKENINEEVREEKATEDTLSPSLFVAKQNDILTSTAEIPISNIVQNLYPNLLSGGGGVSSISIVAAPVASTPVIDPVIVAVTTPVIDPVIVAVTTPVIDSVAVTTPVIDPPPPPPPLITTTIDKDTTLVAGEYTYDNLIITNNAILTLESNQDSSNVFKGVKINAVNITIDAGSYISADGQGYKLGPGTPEDDMAGSGYGGRGGSATAKLVYGSAIKPIDLGSGVKNSGYGKGGGAIRLVVSDTFINNGTVSAAGSLQRSSGGSIYVTTKHLLGEGKFNANGAPTSWPYPNSGGGGRIAIYYEDSSFSGEASALAGVYCFYGCNPGAENGTVGFFNLTDNSLNIYSSWVFEKNDEPFNFSKIILKKNSKVSAQDGVILNADSLLIDEASSFSLLGNQILNIPNIKIDSGGSLTLSQNETINADTILITGGSTLTLSGSDKITAKVLNIKGNSTVTVLPEKILSLTTIPDINIENGSSISADSKGYVIGPGSPSSENYYFGGSYGGAGEQNTEASVYGSSHKPIDFGSGGGGPHAIGGGAIRIITTNLTNNGTISALGYTSSSGGSIYVTSKNISGNGIFSANGGNFYVGGYFSGGGGGGRIALHYENLSFTGKTEVLGGCGSYNGYSKVCAKDGTVEMIDTTIVPIDISNIVTQLKIITSLQNINADTPSSIITVESQNALGEKTVVANTTHVNLSSSSPSGTFASASASTGPNGLCDVDWKSITKITISKGDARRSFCYKDNTIGTHTLIISADDLVSDSQSLVVE